jgi:hypothetical protein
MLLCTQMDGKLLRPQFGSRHSDVLAPSLLYKQGHSIVVQHSMEGFEVT